MGIYQRNVKWLMLGSGTQTILSSAQLFLQISLFSIDEFAVYALLTAYFTVYNFLLEGRFQDVIAYKIVNHDVSHKNRIILGDCFLLESLLKLLILAVAVLSLPYLIIYSGVKQSFLMGLDFVAFTFFVAKMGYGTTTGFLRLSGNSKSFILIQNLEILVRIFGILILYFLDNLNSLSFLVFAGCSLALFNVMQVSICFGLIAPIFKIKNLFKRFKNNAKMIFMNIASSNSDLMTRDLDLLIISGVLVKEELAIYKASKSIAMILWRITDPFYLALMPEINRLFRGRLYLDICNLQRAIFNKMFCITALMAIVFYGALYIILPYYKEASYVPTLGILPIMMFGLVLSAPLISSHPLSIAMGKVSNQFIASSVGVFIGLVLIYPLTQMFGIYGAAAAWSLAFAMTFILLNKITNSHYNFFLNSIKNN